MCCKHRYHLFIILKLYHRIFIGFWRCILIICPKLDFGWFFEFMMCGLLFRLYVVFSVLLSQTPMHSVKNGTRCYAVRWRPCSSLPKKVNLHCSLFMTVCTLLVRGLLGTNFVFCNKRIVKLQMPFLTNSGGAYEVYTRNYLERKATASASRSESLCHTFKDVLSIRSFLAWRLRLRRDFCCFCAHCPYCCYVFAISLRYVFGPMAPWS